VKLSVIIPVWREYDRIITCFEHIEAVFGAFKENVDVCIVDGDAEKGTLHVVDRWLQKNQNILPVQLLSSAAGRGIQMNAGAAASCGTVLLFLHADTLLPENAYDVIQDALEFSSCGAFSLRFDESHYRFRLAANWAGLRSRLERVPYGDQAHFFRRDVFEQLGGYAEVPLMEDVDIMQRVRRKGLPLVITDAAVITSGRRYNQEGFWRRGGINMILRIAYAAGVPEEKLAEYYRNFLS
jgi:rSAM/selenodomain-associated transferase 2